MNLSHAEMFGWGCTSQMKAQVANATKTSGINGYLDAWSTTASCWVCGFACGSLAHILWVGHWARDGGSCSPCPSSLVLVSLRLGCSSPTSPTPSPGTSSWHRTQVALGPCCTMSWPWCWVASIVGTRCCSMMSTMPSPTQWARWANVAASMAGRRSMTQRQRCCTVACGSQMATKRRRCRRPRRSARWWWSRTSEADWVVDETWWNCP